MADESLNRICPSDLIGNDGVQWWIGQIEATAKGEKKNKGGYRYKVAIVGEHPKDKDAFPTEKLPWATIMLPCTDPFIPGNIGGSASQLVVGTWVMGMYLDNDKQKPLILGSIGATPGATSLVQEVDRSGNDPDSRFESGKNINNATLQVDPYGDGETNNTVETQTGVLADGEKTEEGEFKVQPGNLIVGVETEEICVDVAEKCDDKKMSGKLKGILGDFLADVQASNGNIGDYYVSKYTGGLYKGIGTGRTYVNKAVRVVREFMGKLKGYLSKLIRDAVDDLVKALLAPDGTGNRLTGLTEWINKMLKDLGCKIADIGDRLIAWLTNLLFSYINQIYRAAICQVDELVNGIISKIYELVNKLLQSVLGPLNDILGAIAAPLNLIGKAINFVLNLLGLSCSGVDKTCSKNEKVCTTGETDEEESEDFLDKLLDKIDNLFGDTPADYTQYVCDEAFTGAPLQVTTAGFVGGVPKPSTAVTKKPKIVYNIDDVIVEEGNSAAFTVTRTGFIEKASSVNIRTLTKGSATSETDYLPINTILGFAEGESEKQISVQTLVDNNSEQDETFFVKITQNSPEGDEIETKFRNNIGKGTITEKNLKESYDPYNPVTVNPLQPIDEELPSNFPIGDGDEDGTIPTYSVVANRTTCPEDEFIIYTISTTNVENGSILYYTLSGNGITPSDILGNTLTGQFIIQDNSAKLTIGIAEDNVVEDEEVLTFSINSTNANVDVLIVPKNDDQDVGDFDEGIGDSPETAVEDFKFPSVNSGDIITDDNGGIISLPVSEKGDPFAEPPIVFVSGNGIGATAQALLDPDGFVTELRIQSSGFGYKKNLASDKNVRCIIDAFTIISPGLGYTSAPEVLIDNDPNIAEAVIDPKTGFVVAVRILNRAVTFESFPNITFKGGGGSGATVLPSLVCLDTDTLAKVGATKIGTGRYVDCP